jgi:PPOX class probable F420-dependent enzyme
MTSSVIPETHLDLLARPLIGHLATVRADGAPQVSPMWFAWDGTYLRFTHTSTRQKYRNVRADPRVAFSIDDPERPPRHLEIRGQVERIDPDPTAAFFGELADRYSMTFDGPPPDAPSRVVLVVRPESVSYV